LNMALSAKRYLLGVTTAAISPQLAAYFNVEAGALLVPEGSRWWCCGHGRAKGR
jgi:hypothetical protein